MRASFAANDGDLFEPGVRTRGDVENGERELDAAIMLPSVGRPPSLAANEARIL